MPIPDPWNTVLLAFTGVGMMVSAAVGLWAAAVLLDKAVTLLVRSVKATNAVCEYLLHRNEFKKWRQDKGGD